MPNWCDVVYKIKGKDINKLFKIIERLENDEDLRLNKESGIWIGDIIYQLGGNPGLKYEFPEIKSTNYKIDEYMSKRAREERPEIFNKEPVYCRGWVESFEMSKNKDLLTLYYYSAWDELDEFRKFLEQTLDIKPIIYMAEEQGLEIYKTNDKDGLYNQTKYIMETENGIDEYCTEKDLVEAVNKVIPSIVREFETIKEIREFLKKSSYNNQKDGRYMYIHDVKII